MNAYKEIERLSEFQMTQLKKMLDELPLFEIVERTPTKLVVRQEAKNCISMKELLRDWEMVKDNKDGLIIFLKKESSDRTYEDMKYDE